MSSWWFHCTLFLGLWPVCQYSSVWVCSGSLLPSCLMTSWRWYLLVRSISLLSRFFCLDLTFLFRELNWLSLPAWPICRLWFFQLRVWQAQSRTMMKNSVLQDQYSCLWNSINKPQLIRHLWSLCHRSAENHLSLNEGVGPRFHTLQIDHLDLHQNIYKFEFETLIYCCLD